MISPNRIRDDRTGKTEALKARQIETLKHFNDLPSPGGSNKLAMPLEPIMGRQRPIPERSAGREQTLNAKCTI
jgi:hypothetical protein